MILAAHQPNFIPRLSYFDKINKSDVFVLMINCQFEKNGFQNRCNISDKWWTVPVIKGNRLIKDKKYTNGNKLHQVNEQWINAICMTLGIDTSKIRYDFKTHKTGTGRIIELCKKYDCDRYLTNPQAMQKYLDEKAMNDAGIEIIHHSFPYNKSLFEAFNEMGIQGSEHLLEREKLKCGI